MIYERGRRKFRRQKFRRRKFRRIDQKLTALTKIHHLNYSII